MIAENWQPVFNYLEHEARFQAAAATATGAAAAWWLKALLTPAADGKLSPQPYTSRIAASVLALAAFLFLVTEGRISAHYGQLAIQLAQQKTAMPDTTLTRTLVRNVYDATILRAWWPYYSARALLLIAGAIVVYSLFTSRASSSDSSQT